MEEHEIPVGWETVFEKARSDLKDIFQRLAECKGFYPKRHQIFRPFDYVRPDEVRVVIVGQDPYPGVDEDGEPLSNGIPFAVNSGVRLPPSLVNVYRDLERTVPGFQAPRHGNLVPWLRQGVLLLNARLTVSTKSGDEPHDFWAGFLITAVDHIQEMSPGAVFVLWGNVAKDAVRGHLRDSTVVFMACHPSGRNGQKFVGYGTLQAVNEELEKRREQPIDWRLQPGRPV